MGLFCLHLPNKGLLSTCYSVLCSGSRFCPWSGRLRCGNNLPYSPNWHVIPMDLAPLDLLLSWNSPLRSLRFIASPLPSWDHSILLLITHICGERWPQIHIIRIWQHDQLLKYFTLKLLKQIVNYSQASYPGWKLFFWLCVPFYFSLFTFRLFK